MPVYPTSRSATQNTRCKCQPAASSPEGSAKRLSDGLLQRSFRSKNRPDITLCCRVTVQFVSPGQLLESVQLDSGMPRPRSILEIQPLRAYQPVVIPIQRMIKNVRH